MTDLSATIPMEKLADLAKLAITKEDLARYYEPHLAKLLRLTQEMVAINTDQVPPSAHPFETVQRLREDKITESDQHKIYHAVAPCVSDGLYIVPPVIE